MMQAPTEATRRRSGELSRLLHTANAPVDTSATLPPDLTNEEQAIIEAAERYLANGVALMKWWREAGRAGHYSERFDLQRAFNRADSSFGFFGELTSATTPLALMGSVQEMQYDNVRVPASLTQGVTEWLREQVRVFALRYFMRVSDFRQPEAAETYARPVPPPGLGRFSWCPRNEISREGFGFTQLFYKARASGVVRRFSEAQSSQIVDVRELGTTYDYVIAKVRIFDFDVSFRPFGERGPEVVFSLNEESYLVLSREFVVNRDDPEPGVLGEYGIGYAFIKSPQSGFLAYGPGRFDAALELIQFRILASGQIRVHMLFLANRPGSVVRVSVDPVDWAIWTTDWLFSRAGSHFPQALHDILERRPLKLGTFDPVYAYVDLTNAFTAGQAALRLCISRDALDREFLVQHFKQHYQAIVGSLLTWRQIPDWTDEDSLPEWVIAGSSA